MNAKPVLWVYVVLLVVGGLIGFLKGKSKVSLILSVVFAALLVLCLLDILHFSCNIWILVALLLVFAWRLIQTKKFMPSGLMLILTVLALALPHLF